MLITLLSKLGVKSVVLAGFDGFNPSNQENYYTDDISSIYDRQSLLEKMKA